MGSRQYIHDLLVSVLIFVVLFLLEIPYLPIILSFILIFVYSALKKDLREGLGFIWPARIFPVLGLSLLISVLLVICSFYVFRPFLEFITGVPLNYGPFSQLEGNYQLLFVSIGIGWLVGGFMEEIIFRGFFLSRIVDILPGKPGVILGLLSTSIFFGYLHDYQGITGQLLTGIFGLIQGSIYILNKRKIWMNIFIHGFVNTISMMILFFGIQ